jgi:hypothetical protein
VGPDLLDPGRSVGPNSVTADEIRPLVGRNCCIDISSFTQPEENCHAESLELRFQAGACDLVFVRTPEVEGDSRNGNAARLSDLTSI